MKQSMLDFNPIAKLAERLHTATNSRSIPLLRNSIHTANRWCNILRKGDIVANLTKYKQLPFNCPKLGVKAVADPNGEWVKFEDIKEFLKTPTNSAMDAIALATKFLDSNPYDVDTRVVIADFIKFVREQQHQ